MYALYKVEVWIKADIDSGTPLEKVLKEVDNIPANAVDFVSDENYQTETEKFISPKNEATLKIFADNGKLLFENKSK